MGTLLPPHMKTDFSFITITSSATVYWFVCLFLFFFCRCCCRHSTFTLSTWTKDTEDDEATGEKKRAEAAEKLRAHRTWLPSSGGLIYSGFFFPFFFVGTLYINICKKNFFFMLWFKSVFFMFAISLNQNRTINPFKIQSGYYSFHTMGKLFQPVSMFVFL